MNNNNNNNGRSNNINQSKEDKEMLLEEMCWEVISTEPEETNILNYVVKPWEKLLYSSVGLSSLGVAYLCTDRVINGRLIVDQIFSFVMGVMCIGNAIISYEAFNGYDLVEAYLTKRQKKNSSPTP